MRDAYGLFNVPDEKSQVPGGRRGNAPYRAWRSHVCCKQRPARRLWCGTRTDCHRDTTHCNYGRHYGRNSIALNGARSAHIIRCHITDRHRNDCNDRNDRPGDNCPNCNGRRIPGNCYRSTGPDRAACAAFADYGQRDGKRQAAFARAKCAGCVPRATADLPFRDSRAGAREANLDHQSVAAAPYGAARREPVVAGIGKAARRNARHHACASAAVH